MAPIKGIEVNLNYSSEMLYCSISPLLTKSHCMRGSYKGFQLAGYIINRIMNMNDDIIVLASVSKCNLEGHCSWITGTYNLYIHMILDSFSYHCIFFHQYVCVILTSIWIWPDFDWIFFFFLEPLFQYFVR